MAQGEVWRNGEKTVFSINGAGATGCPYGKKYETLSVPQYIKINYRWITDQNVKSKTIKLLQGNMREYLYDLKLEKDF